MHDLEQWRILWELQSGVERIETKLDALAEDKPGSEDRKIWMIAAVIGAALLLPADKQAAVLALLK